MRRSTVRIEMRVPRGREDEGGLARGDTRRTLVDPGPDEGKGALVQGQLADGAALPFDAEHRGGHEVHLVEVELHELVDTQARLGEEGEDREVAGAILGPELGRHRSEGALQFVGREDRRDASGLSHEGDLVGRIDLPAEVALREGGEDPEGRELLVAGGARAGSSIPAVPAEKRLELDKAGHDAVIDLAPEEREERMDDWVVCVEGAGARDSDERCRAQAARVSRI